MNTRAPVTRSSLAVLLAIVILLLSMTVPRPASAEIEMRLNRVESFIPSFPGKKKMNSAYGPELDRILEEIHKRMEAGENLLCSAQIFEEVHWLVNFTTRRQQIEGRMQDLRDSLDHPDQSFAGRQDPEDGSFAPCMEDWLWRFFRSVDPLKELAKRGETPDAPLKIWEPVDTPEEIISLMRNLLVSDLDGEHDKRKELNLAITALGQLLWLDYTDSVFPDHLDREALGDALRRFVDEDWQDEETGYWGAWYRVGESIYRTQDLSITFHIISYLDGEVNHRDRIGLTTTAIRDVKYPYGWDTGGTQNNHHAYDVARIINLTWEDLDRTGRAYAEANLFLMGVRSLAMSIDSRGAFDPRPFTTVGEAYYFGVSFFDEMGIFGNEVPRTTAIKLTNTADLYGQIRANLERLDQTDPWVAAARRKLEEIGR